MSVHSTGLSKIGGSLPLLCSKHEAGLLLGGRARSTVDHLIATGKIKAKKDGKRVLPVVQSIVDYVASLPDVEPQSHSEAEAA
jgi:hypothetical protein